VTPYISSEIGWTLVIVVAIVFALVVRHLRRQAQRLQERSKELEVLSAELIRVNKMKSEFLANVSHELRTPLNAIVGFVDLLREGVYGELTPRQAGPVQRIEASASHLRHLVDQILDLAKMAAGRLEVHSEPIDLRPFILDVATEIEPLVAEKNLYLSLALSSALPRVRTDPTHLRQILVNLLGNAVKYTEKGTITVRSRLVPATDTSLPQHLRAPDDAPTPSSRPWVAVQVVDTGIGIAQGDQARIFEEFEQVNAGPRGDSMNRGTGLGLPISRRLARLLGGDVTVTSELGRGSTFSVWLPGEATQ
jgi:signal transduction histidine kinase